MICSWSDHRTKQTRTKKWQQKKCIFCYQKEQQKAKNNTHLESEVSCKTADSDVVVIVDAVDFSPSTWLAAGVVFSFY